MTGETKDGIRPIDREFLPKEIMENPDFHEVHTESELDLSALIDDLENDHERYKGGSYGDLKDDGYGWPDYEVHHIPADSTSELPRGDGPAIVMDSEDHRKTASCGMTKEAVEYRQTQKELIAEGKYMEAVQMDIDDLHEKFGDKYDEAIKEMLPYAEKVAEEAAAKLKEENHAQI